MNNSSSMPSTHIGISQYLLSLWVIPVLLLLIQAIARLTGIPVMVHLSAWVMFFAPVVFIVTFVAAAFWVHHPVRIAAQKENQHSLEQTMAMLPLRSIKAFTTAGLLCILYMLATSSISSVLSENPLSARMFIALSLGVLYSLGILIPTLAVTLTMGWMAKTRKKLSLQKLFVGSLEQFHHYPWLIRSANRPWLIFGVTSLIPVSILGIFTWLMLGTTNEAEQHFILMQALMLLFNLVISGIALVWVTSRNIYRITHELTTGLNFLRQGRFDGHVAVMVDDDMGDLARGLNTALSGLKERDSLKDSLAIASDIQRGLMPREEPYIQGYTVSGFQQSCYSVGGDYYDYIQRHNGTIWLVIADVAGKGYPAALTVANLQAMLHALANADKITLLDAAGYINQSLTQSLQGGRFVTVFMAELTPETHELEWINAGHIPPLLWQNNQVLRLETISPPFGMLEDIALHTEKITLSSDDILFVCTDGITEARDNTTEMFADQRVETWFKEHHHLQPSELSSSIMDTLDEQGFFTREDDITMLCLKRSSHDQSQ